MGSTQLGSLVYRYDVDGRLVERSGSLAGTNIPATVGSATYNADNELTNWGGLPLTYDYNGNNTQGINGNQYTWDGRNHLTAIASNPAASFVYDAFGRRVKKTISGTTTQYLYDGLNPVQELNSSNVATANLLTGLNIDEFFSRTDSSGARSFLTDMLGSTLAVTDSSGTIQTQYTYEPFGNVTLSGAANGNSYQFTGRENDGTGLYFYRARYYSPTFQRFIAQDPAEFAGSGPNLYTYAAADPIDNRDAHGLELSGRAPPTRWPHNPEPPCPWCRCMAGQPDNALFGFACVFGGCLCGSGAGSLACIPAAAGCSELGGRGVRCWSSPNSTPTPSEPYLPPSGPVVPGLEPGPRLPPSR